MKMDRKAVTDLPIKLLVISVILSISVPIIVGAADVGERNMDLTEMENQAGRIGNAIGTVYYSQKGYTTFVDIDTPEGCWFEMGGWGADGSSIRMYRNGQLLGTHWMEKPFVCIKETRVFDGRCTLKISMNDDSTVRIVLK